MLCRIKTLKLYQYKFSFYRKYEIARSQELKIAVSSATSKCKDVFNNFNFASTPGEGKCFGNCQILKL